MDKEITLYNPTDKEREAQKWVYDNFDKMYENSTNTYDQFNGLTLREYLNESRAIINANSTAREDGRSNIKTKSPMNKLYAILARIALKRPGVSVTAVNEKKNIDMLKSKVYEDLLKWNETKIDRELNVDTDYFFSSFNCATDGTLIRYHGFDNQKHKRKKILDYNVDTGEVETEDEVFQVKSCYAETIPTEDFYVYNPYIRDLQKQPVIAWRSIIDESTFNYNFVNYKKAKHVTTGAGTLQGLDDMYCKDRWEARAGDDQIEVIRMYDKDNDRMVIMANGVVLQDTPIPFKHKCYPFSKTIYLPFAGNQFFWGMSFGYKIQDEAEAYDTLKNIGIEQAKLSVNPPTLTTRGNELEDNMLLPGKTIEVDDVGNFRELTFKSPDSSYFNFLELISKDISLSSVDEAGQGQAQSGITARGQVIAEENARKLLSQFNMMMESIVLQGAKLDLSNILQFMIEPNNDELIRVEGADVGGETGVRQIEVVADKSEMKTEEEIDMIEKFAELQGVKLEHLVVTPDFFENMRYSVKVLSESAYQQGKSLQIALEMQKVGEIARLFPNIFQSSSEIFFKDIVRAFGDDPEKYLEAVKQSTDANAQMLMQQMQGQKGVGGVAGEIAPNEQPGLPELSGVTQ